MKLKYLLLFPLLIACTPERALVQQEPTFEVGEIGTHKISGAADDEKYIRDSGVETKDAGIEAGANKPAAGAELDFILYIQNDSKEDRLIDIIVKIDDVVIAKDEYWYSVHPWLKFIYEIKLSPGKHRITAESKKGEASLSGDFEMKPKTKGWLRYCHNSINPRSSCRNPRFVFDASNALVIID